MVLHRSQVPELLLCIVNGKSREINKDSYTVELDGIYNKKKATTTKM